MEEEIDLNNWEEEFDKLDSSEWDLPVKNSVIISIKNFITREKIKSYWEGRNYEKNIINNKI